MLKSGLTLSLISLAFLANSAMADIDKAYIDASKKLYEQAEIALGNEQYDDAKSLFEQSVVANPKQSESYIGLGKIFYAKEQYALAIRNFDIALTINPLLPEALEEKGKSQLKRHAVDQAKETKERLAEVCGDKSCDNLGRLEAAIADYEKPAAEMKKP